MSKPNILVARAVSTETVTRLREHFEVEYNTTDEVWPKAVLVQKLQEKQGAFTTGSERIDAELLDACPCLRICANMAVGYNNFDLPAMTVRGVLATNTPDVLSETTADHGFALMMAAARRITEAEHFVRAREWKKWSFGLLSGNEVHGTTLGIIGMGRIGLGIARRGALGFGMNVIYHNRSRLDPQLESECNARYAGKEELLRTADHVILVVPYGPASHHMIGAAELALMKPTATLTNIARGGIVDDAALAHALKYRLIAAAGLDVYENEPAIHPNLLSISNVVLTPHIGSATAPTRQRMADLAADNLIGYLLRGRPVTPLNLDVLGAHHRVPLSPEPPHTRKSKNT